MNTNQKSMRYDQNDYDALLHSKIPAALVETPQMNFDDASDASVFFARELDYVKSQSYDVEYPEFTALKLFPVSSEINPGAETVTYYSYDRAFDQRRQFVESDLSGYCHQHHEQRRLRHHVRDVPRQGIRHRGSGVWLAHQFAGNGGQQQRPVCAAVHRDAE